MRAYKNEEKETLANILRDKNYYQHQQKVVESSPALKKLEEKLDKSIRNKPNNRDSSSLINSSQLNFNKDQSGLRFSCKKFKTPRGINPRKTYENYFQQKYKNNELENYVKTAGNVTPEKQNG